MNIIGMSDLCEVILLDLIKETIIVEFDFAEFQKVFRS